MMAFTLEEAFSSVYRAADTLPIGLPSRSIRFGEHRSQFKGDGHDFDRIVEYDPQVHSIAQIDWRSMTKDKVFVREARVTKDFSVIVMADLSTSMTFGVSDRQHKERMLLEVFGDIGLACFHSQDPMGLIGFAGDIIFNETPKVGEDNVFYLMEQLYRFFDGLSSDGLGKMDRHKTDFYNAFDFLMRTYANTNCFVIVISDFIGLQNLPNFKVLEDVLSSHEIALVFLDDPSEFGHEVEFRLGRVRMQNMETGDRTTVARRQMRSLGLAIRRQRKETREKLREI
ncbi:MAG: hypothetical protein HYT62_05195, partial [Candidatus Yanofskybacteria bacterium]|nr:hypothetical protein [Candidatus Yanofskybacteria bacterium]